MLTQVRNQTTENELIVPPLHDSPVSKLIQVPNLQSKEHNLSRKIHSFLFSKWWQMYIQERLQNQLSWKHMKQQGISQWKSDSPSHLCTIFFQFFSPYLLHHFLI